MLLPALAIFFVACGNEPQPGGQGATSQPPSIIERGKTVFGQNCSSCHLLKKDAIGPALQGILSRWDGDSAQLKAYIHNPEKLFADKELHAGKAYEKFKPAMMPGFPTLSDADLNALIAYFQSNQ